MSSHHSVVNAHFFRCYNLLPDLERLQYWQFVAFLRLFVFSFLKNFYLSLVVLGLHCCAGFSLVGESWGCSLGAVHRLLSVAEHAWASVAVTHRLLGSDSIIVVQTQLLCSVQHLSQPETEPVSPSLAGGFFPSEPPGKPKNFLLNELLKNYEI